MTLITAVHQTLIAQVVRGIVVKVEASVWRVMNPADVRQKEIAWRRAVVALLVGVLVQNVPMSAELRIYVNQ